MAVITGIILIAVSFAVVEPTYQAFVFNTGQMKYEFKDGSSESGELYSEGRYYLGLGKQFVTFPKTFQTIDFKESTEGNNIAIRSRDGLVITIEIAFQYSLTTNGKDLLALWMRWKGDYEIAFGKIARNVIRDVASKYDAFEFFFNRSIIITDITAQMADTFLELGANINNFQLLDLTLPVDFNNAIQQTEVTRTKISEATVQQQKVLITAQTDLLSAGKQAEIIRTQAKARADSAYIQKQQDANARKSQIEQEQIALISIRDQLGLTTSELLNYLLIETLKETQAKITFAIENPNLSF